MTTTHTFEFLISPDWQQVSSGARGSPESGPRTVQSYFNLLVPFLVFGLEFTSFLVFSSTLCLLF